MRFYPDRTTVKDRFTAVGARIVSETAERGDLDAAATLESRLFFVLADEDCARKLESHTAPALARAALLAHRYDMALERANRYRIVSDDPIEAEKFARWVEARIEEARGGDAERVAAMDYLAEERAAERECDAVPAGADCRAVVGAVAALARQGRFEQALAVGRVQMASLEDAASANAGGGEALDRLLRTVAARQVGILALSHRYDAAAAAAASALAAWPGDAMLMAAQQRAIAARAEDPFQLGVWPEALASSGMPAVAGVPVPVAGAGLPLLSPTRPAR